MLEKADLQRFLAWLTLPLLVGVSFAVVVRGTVRIVPGDADLLLFPLWGLAVGLAVPVGLLLAAGWGTTTDDGGLRVGGAAGLGLASSLLVPVITMLGASAALRSEGAREFTEHAFNLLGTLAILGVVLGAVVGLIAPWLTEDAG